MNPKATASAPGKLMLFGDHAVVYGYPCLVTAVDQRLQASVERVVGESGHITLISDLLARPQVYALSDGRAITEFPKETRFVIALIRRWQEKYGLSQSLRLETKSEFSSSFGFGSSSAVTVATAVALDHLFGTRLTKPEIFQLCYQAVLDVQGLGSGFDLAAAIWGGTLYFVTGGQTIEPLDLDGLALTVVYTGQKADTVTLVKQVAQLRSRQAAAVDSLFRSVAEIVALAKLALQGNDQSALADLFNLNHGLLASLGVSSAIIESQRYNLFAAGAEGAKLSGAGGGDCVIAIGGEINQSDLRKSVTATGGEVLSVQVNAPGARIEGEK